MPAKKEDEDDQWSTVGSVFAFPGELPKEEDTTYDVALVNLATAVTMELVDYPEIRDDMMMLQSRYGLPVTSMEEDNNMSKKVKAETAKSENK